MLALLLNPKSVLKVDMKLRLLHTVRVNAISLSLNDFKPHFHTIFIVQNSTKILQAGQNWQNKQCNHLKTVSICSIAHT